MQFKNWLFSEETELQKIRIIDILKQKYPNENELIYEKIFSILKQKELEINDLEDRRKSLTINKYLKNLNYPLDNHFFDKISQELTTIVNRKNLNKSDNKKELILIQLKSKLPNVSEQELDILANKVIQNNQNIDQVVRKYLLGMPKGNNKIILSDGNFKIIEVKDWEEINYKNEICHPLFAGTAWCVRDSNYFNSYIQDGSLYLIQFNNKPFALGHKNSKILDIHDNDLNEENQNLVLPIIMKSKIYDLVKGLHFSLIHDLKIKEQILEILFGNFDSKKFKEIFNISADQINKNTVYISSYSDLKELYTDIANRDVPDFTWIEEDYSVDYWPSDRDVKDYIDSIDRKLQQKIEIYFNDNLTQDYDFEKEIFNHSEILNGIKRAIARGTEEGSAIAARKDLIKQLNIKTKNGFYINLGYNSSINEVISICIDIKDLKFLYFDNSEEIDEGLGIERLYDFEYNPPRDGYFEFNKDSFNDSLEYELSEII